MLERKLQNYLIANGGYNLRRIDSDLIFLDSEYSFPGGRIDILALNDGRPVAIELKAKDYSSSQVAGQLINYYNFLKSRNGLVYFVAPKVKPGVFSTLSSYDSIFFFEFDSRLRFKEVYYSNHRKKFFDFIIPPSEVSLSHKYIKEPVAKLFSQAARSILGF